MKSLSFSSRDLICGLLFIAAGLVFAIQAYGLELGTAFRMGPGYFPLVLACILIVLGVIIIIQGTQLEHEPMGPIAWRGILFILPAPVIFGLTVRGLGFVPALFITALWAAFASVKMKPGLALILVGGLTLFSVIVFSYALGLPFRRFGPWLGL
ncbi:tripartite tricarboxylate transporter TctB family protein [Phyllobacterium sp. OV277]|uniref:tripartite tricarboxylate transporter TctB family protein n=1 Tax=Phyllobacterium sp. OV277 TaxID=1882772 RepID=UPI000885D31D|nr:tripartite tricarboxylate transporter TctB family protein [Phyllobacterium sp. OV277]SDN85858.1 Tripartite tricarboxylate transporter TctB family protein [Phyllobacterium sp. OV277]